MSNDHVTGDNTLVSSLTPVVAQCQSLNVQYPCSGPVSLSPTVAAQLSAVRCGHLNPPPSTFQPSLRSAHHFWREHSPHCCSLVVLETKVRTVDSPYSGLLCVESHSRYLLRDCKPSCGPSFPALLLNNALTRDYCDTNLDTSSPAPALIPFFLC